MRDFVFVTGNLHKVKWLETFLGQKVEHKKLDLKEIQSLDPIEVVTEKAEEAYRILGKPVLIDDVQLYFKVLGRLPGTFVKFFIQEIGNDGLCRLLNNYNDRSATASIMYVYYDGKEFEYIHAEEHGKISDSPRGKEGHGWDSIFIPDGQDKTHGEMTEDEYTKYHVRNKAVKKLKAIL